MKLFAERFPGQRPSRGYLAKCLRCGRLVVHAKKTAAPLHLHLRSKICYRLSLQRNLAL